MVLFKDFFGKSLKEITVERQKMVLTSLPPELVFMKSGGIPEYDIVHEPDFIHKITTAWARRAAIDTTYFVLQTRDKIGEPPREEEKEEIMKFVKSLYREDEKGYVQTKFHEHTSIHSVHSAIGIVNILYTPHRDDNRVDWSRPLGKDLLEKYLGKNVVDSIIEFLYKCQKEGGGFVECPYGCGKSSSCPHTLPTINATASAVWCLWHLSALDGDNIKSPFEFVNKHAVRENGEMKMGFKNSLNDERAWVCSTYYIFRIFKTIQNKELVCRLTPAESDKVINFIIDCKVEGSGFGAAKDNKPSIIHTKEAMSLIKDTKYGIDFKKFIKVKETLISDIKSFLNSCEYKGVYGFAERKHYFPNVYATQLAIDTKQSLKMLEGEKSKEVIDKDQKKEILAFLDSCKDKESGGYRGYSFDPTYIPNDWQPPNSVFMHKLMEQT